MQREQSRLSDGGQGGTDDGGAADDEQLMLRAVSLLSKVFLHHLHTLVELPTFHLIWLRALELLEQFMKCPNNDMLLEAVPETLKNMLLVMGTSGAFDSATSVANGGQTLADLTRAMLDTICPQLSASPDLDYLWKPAVEQEAPARG